MADNILEEAEGKNSDSPRPIAKRIGEIIDGEAKR